jgi:hypothetical protein
MSTLKVGKRFENNSAKAYFLLCMLAILVLMLRELTDGHHFGKHTVSIFKTEIHH